MALTNAQKLILKAHINANTDPAIVAALEGTVDEATIAAYYNAATDPAFKVWKSSVNTSDVLSDISLTDIDNLTPGDTESAGIPSLILMLMKNTTLNPSDPVVRGRLMTVFGNGGATSVALKSRFIETASLAESLLASGPGTTTSPATMGWEGTLLEADITAILAAT